jgi:Zn-dependent protease with chaperone function
MKQEYEADAYAANKVGKQAVLQLLHHFKQLKGVSQTEMNNRINAIHKGNYA